MNTDPFEEKLRGLPWRQPSEELRGKIFDAPEPPTHRRRISVPWKPIASAAAVIVFASTYFVLVYSDGAVPQDAAVPQTSIPAKKIETVEIASAQTLFDLSPAPVDTWAGSLTLVIDPN